jgi:HisG, C-terminal domain
MMGDDACVTALPSALGDGYVVEAVVPKGNVNLLIPELEAAGVSSILEVPLAKIVD